MPNAFESGERKLIPATLVYARVQSGEHEEFLMLHRNSADRPGDYHAGKWNGLGGKLDCDESPQAGARRELKEECGIEAGENEFRLLGILQFPNFKSHKSEDWLVYVFTLDLAAHSRDLNLKSDEGTLHWVPAARLLDLNLWAGDRHFVPLVVERQPFWGTIRYEGQVLLSSQIQSW